MAADGAGVRLGGAQDDGRSHLATGGLDPARVDPQHRSALMDGHPGSAHGLGQSAHEARRVDRGAVARVGGPEIGLQPDATSGLVRWKPPEIVFGKAQRVPPRDMFAKRIRLLGCRRDGQRAALGEVAVDVLGLADPTDFIHGVLHRVQQGEPRRRIGIRETLVDPHGHAHAPAAVASARAEANGLGFEYRDAQVRSVSAQIVSGPQPGEAAADDSDIRSRRQRGRRTGFREVVQRVEPEAPIVVRRERHRAIRHALRLGSVRSIITL